MKKMVHYLHKNEHLAPTWWNELFEFVVFYAFVSFVSGISSHFFCSVFLVVFILLRSNK